MDRTQEKTVKQFALLICCHAVNAPTFCAECLREKQKQAIKDERRRVREAIEKLFFDCGVPEVSMTKDGLLASIYPPTPPKNGNNWEDATL